jgi:hypothetical protein
MPLIIEKRRSGRAFSSVDWADLQKAGSAASHDRRKVKFTDYGLELFKATERAQQSWEEADAVMTRDRAELIR